ncbi:UDPglucose 6-dehydrogenase [Paenibacillus cellulosilyticus]|uniref:UDP-glucose 6-dehydrogenase n=1 Tax=Paenibacillus cellulosilyticus TaxID=375489 RepID=A0A2V2YL47_9BACL|nr:UDP-glucose/GDP-mannose dehydrogenase family protein [Paenibacillus cellulosilyticus]PWV93806.1 UDPglucose 6-dehydrogenase [Paenibacillus cellulosilyticus]QKS47421.1 UDP-glucose/GDP-mannose dehydrogenase family protein [Paenibacillus cellulosilyticus]
MKLAVIGTGYVGLVSGVCFAHLGNEVICVDKVNEKIEMLGRGEVPIYEPGLKELIDTNVEAGRLRFSTDLADAVNKSDIVILAVGTPSLPNGEANLTYIKQAAAEIGAAINDYKVIVTKSTVPVGTNEKVAAIIAEQTNQRFDVASVPEFLREGSAIRDTLNPDRIVIGTTSEKAQEWLTQLHSPLTDNILVTDIRSAEMIKYASNAFLATKISFINEIANICEKVGADVTKVAEGMGHDNRIGRSFLKAGIGYGGSCFPKDTQALIQIAGHVDYEFKLLKSVVEVNQDQRFNVIRKLEAILDDLQGKTIAIWGLAFKPETDDIRDAPAVEIIQTLLQRGASVKAYDPVATSNFSRLISHPQLKYCDSKEEAVANADALCLLTEWKEFAEISLLELEGLLRKPILIDGRNVFSEEELSQTSFIYYSVGRPNMNHGVRDESPVLLF